MKSEKNGIVRVKKRLTGCRGIRESVWRGQAGPEQEVIESTRRRASPAPASEQHEGARCPQRSIALGYSPPELVQRPWF